MQDNDPKRCSRYAWCFYDEAGINWRCIPPESPDLNHTENVWHELKDHLRGVVKSSKNRLMESLHSGKQWMSRSARSTLATQRR